MWKDSSGGALDGFGVPYLGYGRDGRRLHASAAAVGLVEEGEHRRSLWDQADRLASNALDARAIRFPETTNSRGVPACVGPFVLSAHALPRSTSVLAVVVVLHPRPVRATSGASPSAGLSAREREVMRLIALGHGTKQIALALDISPHTARHHTESVFSKLGVRSRASVAALYGEEVGSSSHGRAGDRDES